MKNYLKAFLAMGAFLFASVVFADTVDPVINEEDFEGLTAGEALNVSDAKDKDKNLLWQSEEEITKDNAPVLAYADGEKRPSSGGDNNYLHVETTLPLYRKVYNLDPTVEKKGQPQPINSGLYFEGDVQFTPYEDDVDTSGLKEDGTKLLVYIKGTEETTDSEENKVAAATNFVVVAGYYNSDNDVSYVTNYVCEVPKGFDCNKDVWHHLLLKSYLTSEGNRPYFKVFIDGTALINKESKGAATSIMADIGDDAFPGIDVTLAPTTLSGVGFKGTGNVDNLVWTTKDPAPAEVSKAYVWSNGTLSLTVNGAPKEIESGVPSKFYESDVLVVTFKPNAGYLFDATTDVTETIKDDVTTYTYTPQKAGAVVTIDGKDTDVKDFASAVALANDKGTAATVKLLADAEMGEDVSVIFGNMDDDTPTGYNVVLILNEHTLKVPGGLAAVANLTIVDKSQDIVTDTGCIVTKNSEDTLGAIYASTMSIYGGKFDVLPTVESGTVTVPDGYKLTSVADENGWYRLQENGGSTDTPTIDGGDDGSTTVDTDNKTITVESSTSGEITIKGDASEYTISVPQNVTKITGSVDSITIKGDGVDITGAFSVTIEGSVATIALNKEGSVTFTNEAGNEVTVSVTPELDTDTEGTEPFAVGDSVSATVKAIPGLTYQLLTATDLTTSKPKDWGTVGEAVTATNTGTVTLTDTSTDKPDAKFYVIRVSR